MLIDNIITKHTAYQWLHINKLRFAEQTKSSQCDTSHCLGDIHWIGGQSVLCVGQIRSSMQRRWNGAFCRHHFGRIFYAGYKTTLHRSSVLLCEYKWIFFTFKSVFFLKELLLLTTFFIFIAHRVQTANLSVLWAKMDWCACGSCTSPVCSSTAAARTF